MHLIPMPKYIVETEGTVPLENVCVAGLPDGLPSFVKDAFSAFHHENGCVPLTVTCGEDDTAEGYCLTVKADGVAVKADGWRGVYYAAKTLMQLGDCLPCVEIEDAPDFAYRGFYQDVSRGRIPTVDTVKRLIDRLSDAKMNSLQLYVEHTHRFAEYVGINESLGFYTDDDIRELDRYAGEHGIELVPSLSSFGHLYYLLQSDKYHDLCELSDYQPTVHNWHERLLHHTIDPSNPKSVEVITSIMAQYLPLFSSNYFNICCDETFDLCKGKNAGGNVAEAYAAFVEQLAAFLRQNGKTVMMWGDIVMQHTELIERLPDDVVFLNWCYDANPAGLRAEVLEAAGVSQIVCPSVHSHKRFVEKLCYSLPNIAATTKSGFEHGCRGVLTTNWGDYGHLCPDESMFCSMYFAAACSWNVNTDEAAFLKAVCDLVYHNESGEVIDIIRRLNAIDEIWFENEGYEMALWELGVQFFDNQRSAPKDYDYRKSVFQAADLPAKIADAADCTARLNALCEAGDLDAAIGNALVMSSRTMETVLAVVNDVCQTGAVTAVTKAAVEQWFADYAALWRLHNQEGELFEIERFFTVNIYA